MSEAELLAAARKTSSFEIKSNFSPSSVDGVVKRRCKKVEASFVAVKQY